MPIRRPTIPLPFRAVAAFPGFLVLVVLEMAAAPVRGQANFNQPLDRPYTLRNPVPLGLESEYHRMAEGGRMSFLFPRPCISRLDSSRVCGEPRGFAFADSARDRRLNASPSAAYELRYHREWVNALELGGRLSGNNGPVSFLLDAAMFTERHERLAQLSYDREFVEKQDEKASGGFAYSSYSRYRAALSYDLPWGRFTAGRDAVHWGPSPYNSLVFGRMSVPFNQAAFTTSIGPVTVQSLYGELAVEGDRVFGIDPESRSVYAHRYEWNVTGNLLLGMSEQLIVSGPGEPFAMLPVVPLFIFKGDTWERLNNGNLAFDICYRREGVGRVYSEFLIDDMQSPGSLFDDQWGNKWGWTLGLHVPVRAWSRRAGLTAEYSRVEPWVYTHYVPATAQAANLGFPLGSQHGPNSQNALLSLYILPRNGWSVSYTAGLLWKGTDPGSAVADTPPPTLERKEFLKGVGSPQGTHVLLGHYGSGRLGTEFRLEAAESVSASARLRIGY